MIDAKEGVRFCDTGFEPNPQGFLMLDACPKEDCCRREGHVDFGTVGDICSRPPSPWIAPERVQLRAHDLVRVSAEVRPF
jgi:hypothetical protein